VDILGNQVQPVVQMFFFFSNNDAVYQDDNSPIHTARTVQSRTEEYEDALQHFLWPAKPPDFNIIETLWSF
jgi:hypothetical protein